MGTPVRSVVLGVDGSPHSRRAAAFLGRLAPPARGHVTVVSVVEPVRAPSVALMPAGVRSRLAGAAADLERGRLAAARRSVDDAARALEKAGWTARTSVRSGVPLAELLQAVKQARADLLVLGARGTGGLDRLLLGSVADGALKRSGTAVLIVK